MFINKDIISIIELYKLTENGKLKYNALIDAGTLFKQYSLIKIVETIYETIKKYNYKVVYLDSNQDKFILMMNKLVNI